MGSKNISKGTLFFIAPIYGYSGDAVNERQLLNAISKHFDKIFCFTNIKKHKENMKLNSSIKLIDSLPIPSISIPLKLLWHFIMSLLYVFLAKTLNPCAIYIRGHYDAIGLSLLKPLLHIPLVYKFDNFMSDELEFDSSLRRHIYDVLDIYALNKVDLILVQTEHAKMDILRRVKFVKATISLCPPGIDLKKVEKVCNKKDNVLKSGEMRIGFLGSLFDWQGVDILIKAMSKVQLEYPTSILYIVGGGPLYDYAKNLIKKYNVKAVMTGYVSHEKALELLKSFYVMVLPRRKSNVTETTIPIKVIEAFALGVPIIATPHEVFLDTFKEGEGILYADPDEESLSNRILLLLKNPELKEQIAKKMESHPIIIKYNYDAIAEKVSNEIRNLRKR